MNRSPHPFRTASPQRGEHGPHPRHPQRTLRHAPPRPGFGLPRWQRRLLLAVLLLLAPSGVAWLALHYLAGAGAGELPHPAEPWLMKLHGAGAFAALFAAGVLAGSHVGPGWRVSGVQRRQRRSGLGLCALLGATALSAWALYYAAPEDVRPLLGWVHAGLGGTLAALGGWHARRRWLT